jgi:toxin HigB-1
MPIQSFKTKETAAIFDGQEVKKLPRDMQAMAKMKLALIDAALFVQDLRVPPGNMLEKLLGKRKGQWSIRINKQWRICFNFDDDTSNASHVEICDYH